MKNIFVKTNETLKGTREVWVKTKSKDVSIVFDLFKKKKGIVALQLISPRKTDTCRIYVRTLIRGIVRFPSGLERTSPPSNYANKENEDIGWNGILCLIGNDALLTLASKLS